MSSRSVSLSPDERKPKQRKRSQSRSPMRKSHKSQRREDWKGETRERDKDNRYTNKESHHKKRRYDNSNNDDDKSRQHIKQEPPDRGYESRQSNNEWREQQAERDHHNRRRREDKKHKPQNPFKTEDEKYEYGKKGDGKKDKPKTDDMQKPNFGLSGKLTEDTNTFKGVVIKYNEPPEARKPKKRWRWYPFKGEQSLPVLHLHRQSAYLLGRDRRVADIPTDHPSCSKQHAVLQFRMVEYNRDDGTVGRRVRPYIIDLGSGNGTFLNNQKIEEQRYVELKEKDVVKFGFSSREYVLLHDATDTTAIEDESD